MDLQSKNLYELEHLDPQADSRKNILVHNLFTFWYS